MQNGRGLLLLALLTFSLLCVFVTVPVQAAETAEWKDADPVWYYENLDLTERKKIRQAIDYCIPRETIIEGLHHGYAAAITSPIGVNFEGVYEPTIDGNPDLFNSRKFSPSKALTLLKDVFGLLYDEKTDGTNATHTNVPYFRMTLIDPITNVLMPGITAGSLIARELNKVGIEATLEWWTKENIITRVFFDPTQYTRGYDFLHGGYDMFIFDFGTSPDPMYKEYYDRDCYPPSANCYWIKDGAPTSGEWVDDGYESVTALWNAIYTEMDVNKRIPLLKEYQQWCYDQVPTCIIYQEIQPFAMDIEVTGWDNFHGFKQNLCNVTLSSGVTSAVIAHPGEYVDFNPLQSSSYYDFIVIDNIHCALAKRRGEYNLTHSVPWIAESWMHSDDYKTWTITLRQGLKWSDGTEVTAEDVVFSYQMVMDEAVACPSMDYYLDKLGNASNVKIGKDGYEVIFNLPRPYLYFETETLTLQIVQKEEMSAVPKAEWKIHDTNTKRPSIGCGPYMLDPDNTKLPNTVALKVNLYYNQTAWGHDPNLVGGGYWAPNPTLTNIEFKVVKNLGDAFTGLKTGTYDFIDSQMDIQALADEINVSTWGKITRSYEWGYQEMGINHAHHVFGMNPRDPREAYPDFRFPPDYKTRNKIFIFFSLLPLYVIIIAMGTIMHKRFLLSRKK